MTPIHPKDDLLRAPTAKEMASLHSWTQVWLQRLVDAILQPYTFLAGVIWLFGGTYSDVAVIAVASAVSYSLGSLLMPFALAKVNNIRLVLLGASAVRAVASAIIAIVGWRASSMNGNEVVLWLVIALLFYQVSSAANVSRNPRSFIANLDQPTSARSRQVVGALAGGIGAFIAWRALGNRALDFEQAAGILLFLAGVASLGSVWFQITAPVRYRDMHQKLPVPSWKEIEHILRVPEIRRYLGVRALYGFATITEPFIVIYGITELHLNLRYLGAAMLAIVVAQITGGAIWTFFGEMPGSRKAIQMATILRFAALTLAISLPFLGASSWYQSTFESRALVSWLFVSVFYLIGLSQNTFSRNEQHYAMNRLHDGALYPAMDMVLNTLLVVAAFAPLLGVALIRAYDLRTALMMALVFAFLAFLSTAFLVARKSLPRRNLSPGLRGPLRPVKGRSPRIGGSKVRRVR